MKKQVYRSKLMKKRAIAGYFFTLPLIIGICFIFIPNLILAIQFSLQNVELNTGGTGPTWYLGEPTFDYYVRAVTESAGFYVHFGTSMRTFGTNVPVLMIFSLFVAVLLNQKFHGRTVARAIFFIPVILATGIIGAVEDTTGIMGMVESSGVETGTGLDNMATMEITGLLTSMNFNDTLISIVTGAIASIYTVVQDSGMQIFIFLAGLQEIPVSLYEAAQVEGCSAWELFWKITFPMISPQIAVNLIYTIVDTCADTDSELFNFIYTRAFSHHMYSEAMAMYLVYLAAIAGIVGLVFILLARFVHYSSK